MADQGTAVATRQSGEIGQFQAMLETRSREIQMALPSHITPDKFQRTVMTAVAQNPDLLKADRHSLILACYKAAQDGLLPDGREAALVVFKLRYKDPEDQQWKSRGMVQYIPMVYGLRKKILQSGDVVALEVSVVYRKEVDAGHFYYEVGKYPPLGHRPMLDLTMEDATDENIVGAYSIATMKDGTKSYEFMRRFEIDKVRECSQTGATRDRFGKPRQPSGPWVEWFPEQAKKTVMRRHAKQLPQSGDIIIDVEGRELEHGSSAALALGVEPDAPTLITDDSGDTIDTTTGEVVTEDGGGEPEQDDQNDDDSGGDEQPTATSEDRKMADQIIKDIKAAKTPAAAKAAYLGSELELAAMPEALSNEIDVVYEQRYRELAAKAKQTEPAK